MSLRSQIPTSLSTRLQTPRHALCGVCVEGACLSPSYPPHWLETPAVLPDPPDRCLATPGTLLPIPAQPEEGPPVLP